MGVLDPLFNILHCAYRYLSLRRKIIEALEEREQKRIGGKWRGDHAWIGGKGQGIMVEETIV